MGFLAKVVLNLLRSLFLFNRSTEKNTNSCTKAVDLVKKLVSADVGDNMTEKYETDLEIVVAEAFGVEPLLSSQGL